MVVSQEYSEMLEQVSTMRELVLAAAGLPEGSNWKSVCRLAARHADVSFRTAKSVYYGDITDDDHKAVIRMKKAAGRYESLQLASRFDGLAQALRLRDPDFHMEDIAALVAAASALRRLDRTITDESS